MIDSFIEILGADSSAISSAERIIQNEISQHSRTIESYSLKEVPEKYIEVAKKSQLFIFNLFLEQGYITDPSDFKIPKFIIPENRDFVETSLEIRSKGSAGIASRVYGDPIVFLDNNLTDIEIANTICHEMIHFASKSIFLRGAYSISERRVGMEVKGTKPELNQWFFEEATAYYFAEKFIASLKDDPIFSKDLEIKTEVINQLSKNEGLEKGKIVFEEYGLSVDPKYTVLTTSKDQKKYSLGVRSEGLSGYILDLITKKFSPEEKSKFLGHLLSSRFDLKEIGKFANMLNAKFGKGTYTKLARCNRIGINEMKKLIAEFS